MGAEPPEEAGELGLTERTRAQRQDQAGQGQGDRAAYRQARDGVDTCPRGVRTNGGQSNQADSGQVRVGAQGGREDRARYDGEVQHAQGEVQ